MARSRLAPQLWPHLALLLQQCLFGVSTVLYKLALPKFNPITFCFIREVGTGFVLMLAMAASQVTNAQAVTRRGTERKAPFLVVDERQAATSEGSAERDLLLTVAFFLAAGFFLWLGQVAMLLGLKMYGPEAAVAGSCWHPTQPLWTVLFSIFVFRMERMTPLKLGGILLGALGAGWMSYCKWARSLAGSAATSADSSPMLGTLLFMTNAISSALLVICMRKLQLRTHMSALGLTALAYTTTVCLTLPAALYINGAVSPSDVDAATVSWRLLEVVCVGEVACLQHPWAVPGGTLVFLCLVWTVCVHSGFATFLQTWALKRLDPSEVSFYTVLQPVASALVILVFGALHMEPLGPNGEPLLGQPSWKEMLGVLPIGLGLLCIASEASKGTT